jgi:hypothetical protein
MKNQDEFDDSYLYQDTDVESINHMHYELKNKGMDYECMSFSEMCEFMNIMSKKSRLQTKQSVNKNFLLIKYMDNIKFKSKQDISSKNSVDFIVTNFNYYRSGNDSEGRGNKIIKYYKCETEARIEATILKKLNTLPVFKRKKISSIDSFLTGLLNKYRKKQTKLMD